MIVFVILAVFLLIVLPSMGFYLYYRSRRLLREAKNYERSFKMIPLLIHLPPLSDDIDNESRDARDIADENISRAQTLYNIVASIGKKGFKSKFYGQRHIGIEIIASKGFVHFYVVVPLPLVPVVEQAVTSAYPLARLEEVADHNIFSQVGRLSGTSGGEITLKENYAYPIAVYQEIKRDTMQSLLNALSALENEDGAAVQILLRPAHSDWSKAAKAVASKKRKGKDKKSGAGDWLKHIAAAPIKSPEYKEDGGEKPLSALDQGIVDAIDDKTRSAGFEVMIRLVVSSNLHQRSQTVLNNIVATFALFDSPGRNGFKFVPAKDIEHFTQGYILRFFPQESNKMILNTNELATLFHFPDQSNIPTTQLERQQSKQVDGPRKVSEKGIVLGYNVFRGTKKRINLDPADRRRHMYVVGQTGTGKSVFLKNCAVQDMLNGDGFCFIDPHGDAVDDLLAVVPKERTEDIIYFSPADMEFPLGLNLFEFHSPEQKDFLIQGAIDMLYKLYDPQHQGIIGPRYEHWFRNAALTLMADPAGATFIDIPKVFTDNNYAKQKLKFVTDQTVLDFWNKEMASTSDYHKSEVLGWFVSKFGAFLSNEMMRNIIGQTKGSFNLREIMDNKKILLVNLSKGKTGELNSKLLGMIFVMQFQAAAMSRSDVDMSERPDFCLYVDEFQNYSTDSFATILSEARKFGLNLIVANQFTTQLTDEIRDAVFGNVGTIVSFRVGTQDAEALSKVMQPVFDADDLQRIPNGNMAIRMLIDGIPTQPFSMQGLPYFSTDNKKLADALKQLSAAKYGRPRAEVEKEIFARLATEEPAAPAKPAGSPFGGAVPAAPAPRPAAPPSFLDDWLTKRQQKPGATLQGSGPASSQPVVATAASSLPSQQPKTQPISDQQPVAQAAPQSVVTPALANTTKVPKAQKTDEDPKNDHEEPSAELRIKRSLHQAPMPTPRHSVKQPVDKPEATEITKVEPHHRPVKLAKDDSELQHDDIVVIER